MNLPNKITILRLFLTLVFLALVFIHGVAAKASALIVFFLAAYTDYLDGYFAKKYNLISDFGKLMDPVADKVLTLTAFMAFVEMKIIPAWMVIIIIIREMTITGLRIARLTKHNDVLAADKGGKHKTVSQMVSIGVILIFILLREGGTKYFAFWTPQAEAAGKTVIFFLMLITVALTVSSGLSYVTNNRKYLFNGKNP